MPEGKAEISDKPNPQDQKEAERKRSLFARLTDRFLLWTLEIGERAKSQPIFGELYKGEKPANFCLTMDPGAIMRIALRERLGIGKTAPK